MIKSTAHPSTFHYPKLVSLVSVVIRLTHGRELARHELLTRRGPPIDDGLERSKNPRKRTRLGCCHDELPVLIHATSTASLISTSSSTNCFHFMAQVNKTPSGLHLHHDTPGAEAAVFAVKCGGGSNSITPPSFKGGIHIWLLWKRWPYVLFGRLVVLTAFARLDLLRGSKKKGNASQGAMSLGPTSIGPEMEPSGGNCPARSKLSNSAHDDFCTAQSKSEFIWLSTSMNVQHNR